jgi:hypothetical protein
MIDDWILGTRYPSLRVCNRVPLRKKDPTVTVIANPTGPYWECFTDRIFASCCLLQHPVFAFHVEGVEGCRWHHWSWYILDKISGCSDDPWGPLIKTYIAPFHCSSYRTILCPSEKESCMGSNMSSAPFGHVQCRQKSTEAQIFKNHWCQCAKRWFLL